MKPITDETIHRLIERAKRRQAAGIPANDEGALEPRSIHVARRFRDRVISIDFVRKAPIARHTFSGVFFYTPREKI